MIKYKMQNQPIISVIVASDEKRGIGKNGKIPWHIKEDLVFFRQKTQHHTVIMGQNSYHSMLAHYKKSGKQVPQRTHIVLTKDKNYKSKLKGAIASHSISQALAQARQIEKEEVFIAGGGQIYSQMLKFADKLYLTLVKGNFQADTFFPDYSAFSRVISRRQGSQKPYRYTFLELTRPKSKTRIR